MRTTASRLASFTAAAQKVSASPGTTSVSNVHSKLATSSIMDATRNGAVEMPRYDGKGDTLLSRSWAVVAVV